MFILKNKTLLLVSIMVLCASDLAIGGWFSNAKSHMQGWFKTEQIGTDGFSHREHVISEEIECDSCHKASDSSDDISMPTLADCTECHEDDEALSESQKSGQIKWAEVVRQDDELIFNHKMHSTAEINCDECHVEISNSTSVPLDAKMMMDDCTKCHLEVQRLQAEDCTSCHKEVRKDKAPQNHGTNMKRTHGHLLKSNFDLSEDNCSVCHEESSCEACHLSEAPKNHNNHFRDRGHGLLASMDRDNCSTCHKEDSCDRCHQSTEPINHRASFGSPRNNHCVSCHLPLKDEGCAACHKSANSHSLADALPSNSQHTQAKDSDCRECHTGAKLSHFDNGSSCRECHK